MSLRGGPVLAMDIGGTQIKAGLIRPDGVQLGLKRADTESGAEPERIVQKTLAAGRQLCQEAGLSFDDLDGLGISIAAFITAEGLVTATAHLSKDWIGYDLGRRLGTEIPFPTYFALDTPAPTLGEAFFGAGSGVENFVYITVSTGIGAGIMSGGKYLAGGLGWAGGVGHTIIDERSQRICEGCGNRGCLETFAAKQGILATALDVMDEEPQSLLSAWVQSGADLTPRLVFEAAQQADRAAIEVFQRAGHALGIGLTNLVDIISPSLIVVGGGIALAGDLLLEPARRVVAERAFPPAVRRARIVPAALGDLSGMYGAAAMVFHDIRINPTTKEAKPV